MKPALLIVIGLLLFSSAVLAQEVKDYNPYQSSSRLWTSFEIHKKIGKDFRLDLGHGFRYKSLGETWVGVSEVALKYEAVKWMDFKAVYRKNSIDSRSSRLGFDVILNKRVKPFTISWRSRLTSQPVLRGNDYLRERIKVKIYKKKKVLKKDGSSKKVKPRIIPTVQIEGFLRLNKRDHFERLRSGVGFDFEITKKLELEAFYFYTQEYNVNYPEKAHVFGTSFALKL